MVENSSALTFAAKPDRLFDVCRSRGQSEQSVEEVARSVSQIIGRPIAGSQICALRYEVSTIPDPDPIVIRLRSGEPVAAVAVETGICQATLFRWKRQVLIDAGVIEGTPSAEADELTAAHKRVAQEADALCGAGYGERSTDRTHSRNGYFHR